MEPCCVALGWPPAPLEGTLAFLASSLHIHVQRVSRPSVYHLGISTNVGTLEVKGLDSCKTLLSRAMELQALVMRISFPPSSSLNCLHIDVTYSGSVCL